MSETHLPKNGAEEVFGPPEHQLLMQLLWEDVDATKPSSDGSWLQPARRQFLRSMFAVVEAAIWIFKQEALEQHARGVVVFTPSELALLAEKSPVLESDGTVRDAPALLRFAPNVLFAFKCHAQAHSYASVLDVSDHHWGLLRRSAGVRNRLMHPKELASMHVSDAELSDARQSLSWFAKISSLALVETSGWFASKAAAKIPNVHKASEVQQLFKDKIQELRRTLEETLP
jgi:hypothetical protein